MELQSALISIVVSIVGMSTTFIILSARGRYLQRQRNLVLAQAEADREKRTAEREAKRQETEEANRQFLVKQVDLAIANADEARKESKLATQSASEWKLLNEGLQGQNEGLRGELTFLKKQITEFTTTLLEHKKQLEAMPGMAKTIEEQKLLIEILSKQLDNIPKLENEIERLHKQLEDQAKQIGQLENQRTETSRLLATERKVYSANEAQSKREITRLTNEVRNMSEENARLKKRVAALENSSPVSTNPNPAVVEEKI